MARYVVNGMEDGWDVRIICCRLDRRSTQPFFPRTRKGAQQTKGCADRRPEQRRIPSVPLERDRSGKTGLGDSQIRAAPVRKSEWRVREILDDVQ